MNWKKVRYALWILGFLYLASSAISFVSDVSQDAAGKTGAEQWVIGLADVLGVSLVLAYWGWKWYQCRDYIQGSLPFPTKKVVIYGSCIMGLFLFVIIFIKTIKYIVESAPEFLESQEFVKNNAAVTAKLGAVTKLVPDDSGESFEVNGNARSGTYQFQVIGSVAEGVLRIEWHDESGKFVPTEIDEIISSDNSTILWKSKGS